MDGQVVSLLDLSPTLLAGGGLLVPYSLSGSPAIKQLMQMVTMVPGQGGRFQSVCFPSTSSEYSGVISFRIDWFDLFVVQGTLRSLLSTTDSKSLILWHSTFFMVQLSHPHMTTGKTIALTIWAFVGKAITLLFNMLSRLVITFLSGSKCLLISW